MVPDTAKPRIAVALTLLCLAAGPATKPVDRDTTEVVAASAKARFRVPQFWQPKPIPKHLSADEAFLFDPTPLGKKPKRVTMLQLVEVMVRPAAAGEDDLKALADKARAKLLSMNPNLKFTKDASVTFAGRTVWTLQWTQRIPLKTQPAADGTQKSLGFVDIDRIDYDWPEHGAACHFGMHADTRFMPSLVGKVEAVVRTLAFDG